jgi:hypothetical protein
VATLPAEGLLYLVESDPRILGLAARSLGTFATSIAVPNRSCATPAA